MLSIRSAYGKTNKQLHQVNNFVNEILGKICCTFNLSCEVGRMAERKGDLEFMILACQGIVFKPAGRLFAKQCL